MSFKSVILEVVEDLSSLEVATLTKSIDTLPIGAEPDDVDDQVKAAELRVKTARDKLLAAINTDEDLDVELTRKEKRKKIRTKKEALREAKNQLDETKKAIGSYDPKDIFSKIRAKLPEADLVAYSRFELGGDSTNFINSNPDVRGLVNKHNHMVIAAQEARKALFATILNLGDDDDNSI